MPAHRRLRQNDIYKFDTSLVYIVDSRSSRVTQ